MPSHVINSCPFSFWVCDTEVVPANMSALAKVHGYSIALKHSIIWSSKLLASHDSYQCCIEKKPKSYFANPSIAHFAAPFLYEQLEEQPFKKLGITNKNSLGVIWSDNFYFSRNCKTKLEKSLDSLQKTLFLADLNSFSQLYFPVCPCAAEGKSRVILGASAQWSLRLLLSLLKFLVCRSAC